MTISMYGKDAQSEIMITRNKNAKIWAGDGRATYVRLPHSAHAKLERASLVFKLKTRCTEDRLCEIRKGGEILFRDEAAKNAVQYCIHYEV